jgi:HTH-type transcriptional regulator/antitoxin HigA
VASHLRPVRTSVDHKAALKRIERLMDAAAGTAEADELEVLATLVDRYESSQWPIVAPSPIDALRFCMEQAGLSRRDLEPMIGTRARVSEVLAGRRTLTLAMIRALHEQLGIPAESLIGVNSRADSGRPQPPTPRKRRGRLPPSAVEARPA